MRLKRKLKELLIILTILVLTPVLCYALSGIQFDPQIEINRDCSESEAELTIRMTIPQGTPIGELPSIIETLMAFYRDLWSGNDPTLKKIIPSKEKLQPEDIRAGSKAISGADAIIILNRAFREVEEQGLIAFPEDVPIIIRETIPLFEECLLNGGGKNPNNQRTTNLDNRIPSYRSKNISDVRQKQLTANSNTIAVSIVSFRSENSRFPADLEELKSSGHLQIKITNPFTKKVLTFHNENGPGTFSYSRPSEEKYILTVFDAGNLPIRRELITRTDIPLRGVLSVTKPNDKSNKPFTKQEQTARIYVFQIGQLLNSFYETNKYLPRNISHIEAQGFAYINFINPFTSQPIRPSKRIDKGAPGSYYYILLGEDEYILGGYGEDGRKVIEIHRKFMGNMD